MPTAAILEAPSEESYGVDRRRTLARVLLADSDLASRLTLKTVLRKVGYDVEGAATSAEALSLLDQNQFQLVLADLRSESPDAAANLLAYARQKEYRPATATLTSDMSALEATNTRTAEDRVVHMSNEDISHLLIKVAELISNRADRRMRRPVLPTSL